MRAMLLASCWVEAAMKARQVWFLAMRVVKCRCCALPATTIQDCRLQNMPGRQSLVACSCQVHLLMTRRILCVVVPFQPHMVATVALGPLGRLLPDAAERRHVLGVVAQGCQASGQMDWAIELFQAAGQVAAALNIV